MGPLMIPSWGGGTMISMVDPLLDALTDEDVLGLDATDLPMVCVTL